MLQQILQIVGPTGVGFDTVREIAPTLTAEITDEQAEEIENDLTISREIGNLINYASAVALSKLYSSLLQQGFTSEQATLIVAQQNPMGSN